MLQFVIVRSSCSPWALPLYMVPKKIPGDWRLSGCYRLLNKVTMPDRYPIPHLHDITSALQKFTMFSKIDLVRAYQKILLAEANILKTAVTTSFSLFEFTRLPFWLRNAAQTFQRFMYEVYCEFDFVHPYIDDILVAILDPKTHEQHLRLLFDRLQQHRITVNPSNCDLGKPSIEFLGHRISSAGIEALLSKVQAIME